MSREKSTRPVPLVREPLGARSSDASPPSGVDTVRGAETRPESRVCVKRRRGGSVDADITLFPECLLDGNKKTIHIRVDQWRLVEVKAKIYIAVSGVAVCKISKSNLFQSA